MRKLFLGLMVSVISVALSAQDLQTIVKKHIEATGGKTLAACKTLAIEGKISQMGMSLDLKMFEKKPDKIKVITTFSGMDMVQVINGNAGYMINPMMGSSDPISLTAEQVAQGKENSTLANLLETQLMAGKLELTGSSDIAGEAAFELKSTSNGMDSFIYISKKSYYTIAVKMTAEQMGQQYNVEMRMKDYTDISGVKMAMTIDTYVNGSLSGTMTYSSIKFDLPIADSEFEIK